MVATAQLTLAEAQGLWDPAVPYLNTASFGLPPKPAFDAVHAALADWRAGRTSWEQWQESTEGARAAFARLVGVERADVAVGSTVSGLVGLVAGSVPDGARVVTTEREFASLLYPWLVQSDRGVDVVTAPIARLQDTIDERTTVVAVSAVQSSTGEVADLESISDAARAYGALTVVDATQAIGWLPVDASRIDVLACHAYKWLMSPRGSAFMAVRPELLERIRPSAAGWFAGEDPHASYYGPELSLARSARRLDVSPAWFSWIGTLPALELVERIGIEAIHEHDVGLANRFREGLGLAPGDSAIVSADVPGAAERLERAGIRAAVRAGSLRASFHVYNTEADVDAALTALG